MKYLPLSITIAIFVLDLVERLTAFSTPLTFYLWMLGIGVVTASVVCSVAKIVMQRSFWTFKDVLGTVAVGVLSAKY